MSINVTSFCDGLTACCVVCVYMCDVYMLFHDSCSRTASAKVILEVRASVIHFVTSITSDTKCNTLAFCYICYTFTLGFLEAHGQFESGAYEVQLLHRMR